MKPVFLLIAITGVQLLGGCGAVGALEEDNADLQTKVDSLSMTQHQMKERMTYLEQENVKLDSRNKQLSTRIEESGALTPPDYTVTSQPLYAQPAPATPVPQSGQPQQPPQTSQATPQVVNPGGREGAISPNNGAAPWRAEQQAIQSGAAAPQLEGKDTWTYGAGERPSNGYTYNDAGPSTQADGYTYNREPKSVDGKTPSNWNYDKKQDPSYESDYSRQFDNRSPSEPDAWNNRRNQTATSSRVAPTEPATPQATYERQAQQQLQRQYAGQTQVQPRQPVATPRGTLPPSRVSVSRSEAARPADYSYLARYQQGYDAYQSGNYNESIQILSDLASTSDVNNTSDNCDFWIAEAYYALGDYASARVYYSRVVSYPRSDKADKARARLRSIQ